MGAVFLACKLEEQHRRIRHIINVFDYLRRVHDGELKPAALHAAAVVPVEQFGNVCLR